MNFLNVTNIHDCSEAHYRVGLKKATMFDVTNDGSCIKIEDKANTVTKLKVGGSAGFTISYSGGKITFSANSGASPLRIIEPNIGGIPECPYLYTHQDKYSGGSTRSKAKRSIAKSISNIPDASEGENGSLLIAMDGEWVPISMHESVSQITENVKSQLGL